MRAAQRRRSEHPESKRRRLAGDSTMSKSLGPKSGRVDQAERFFDTAQAHGGGARPSASPNW